MTAASPLLNAANPFFDEAVEKIGGTVSLTLRSGFETICVARRLGSYPIQILSLGVGVRRPIGISASSVALLSSLSSSGALRERGLVQGTRAVSIAFGKYRGEALATLTVTAIAHRMQAHRVMTIVEDYASVRQTSRAHCRYRRCFRRLIST